MWYDTIDRWQSDKENTNNVSLVYILWCGYAILTMATYGMLHDIPKPYVKVMQLSKQGMWIAIA